MGSDTIVSTMGIFKFDCSILANDFVKTGEIGHINYYHE